MRHDQRIAGSGDRGAPRAQVVRLAATNGVTEHINVADKGYDTIWIELAIGVISPAEIQVVADQAASTAIAALPAYSGGPPGFTADGVLVATPTLTGKVLVGSFEKSFAHIHIRQDSGSDINIKLHLYRAAGAEK